MFRGTLGGFYWGFVFGDRFVGSAEGGWRLGGRGGGLGRALGGPSGGADGGLEGFSWVARGGDERMLEGHRWVGLKGELPWFLFFDVNKAFGDRKSLELLSAGEEAILTLHLSPNPMLSAFHTSLTSPRLLHDPRKMGPVNDAAQRLRSRIESLKSILDDLREQLTEAEGVSKPELTFANGTSYKTVEHEPTPSTHGDGPYSTLIPEEYRRYGRQMIMPEVGLNG